MISQVTATRAGLRYETSTKLYFHLILIRLLLLKAIFYNFHCEFIINRIPKSDERDLLLQYSK